MVHAIDSILLILKSFYYVITESLKAFIPYGVLPRKDVSGHVVLVTGAGSGIGRIIACKFAEMGCSLVLWDVNEKNNKETLKMIFDLGAKAIAHTVDVSQKAQVTKKANSVRDEIGHVDILINNAGIVSGKHLLDCSDEQIEKTIAVNTTAHFWTTRAFLPHMLERNDGHIVTIASIAGHLGAPKVVDYCTSKFGAVGFHDALTAELHAMKKDGVKTTVVCPHFIDTGMFDGFDKDTSILLPVLTPENVAECVVEATLTNKSMIAVPKISYFAIFLHSVLPTKSYLCILELLGMDHAMDSFRGRNNKVK